VHFSNFDLSNGSHKLERQKFSPAFFKRRRGRGRGALVARRNERNLFTAFLFCKAFFFAPVVSKKKALLP
jgi:hypothetical protein